MAEETTKEKRKKKKKRRTTGPVAWLHYLMLRVAVVFVYIFDVQTNLGTARFLGRLLWRFYHRGRKRALDNLRASFPEKSERWIIQTGRRSFEQLAMLAMDVLFTPRLVNKHNWRSYSRYTNCERVKWMMQAGQGILLVGGHYGNFEIPGYLLGLFGFNVYSIARPLDNRYINSYLLRVRRRTGQNIIDKKGAAQRMHEIASAGGILGFIADQDAGRKGVFVDFFGRKASTYKSIGLLAIEHNLPVAAGISRRRDNRFFFDIEITRLILPDEWADKADPLYWITQEYTRALEQAIRKDPTQYWWLHRRWKTRPREERAAQRYS